MKLWKTLSFIYVTCTNCVVAMNAVVANQFTIFKFTVINTYSRSPSLGNQTPNLEVLGW